MEGKKKILIVYYSATGNTEKMARLIEAGVTEEKGLVTCKRVEETNPEELLEYQGIIIGSPTYYGTMAYQVKQFLDESVRFHGKLEGKVGAAFSSSANIGGGNETTVTDILHALLIHGMVIQGDCQGGHYGVVSIGLPDARVEKECHRLGRRGAYVVDKLN
ncbi:MAG: NAD(P)H-dependent oxidoreductase [Candidatus Omnitrophica bacterium]|nr:NAD(P)H-dependent oxidoreductase [Candidatus Omnitrophota bacterium]